MKRSRTVLQKHQLGCAVDINLLCQVCTRSQRSREAISQNTAWAQTFANGPFQLRISSLSNASIDGHASPCRDTLALCYDAQPAPRARSTNGGFVFTSRGRADYTVGYLSYTYQDAAAATSGEAEVGGGGGGQATAYGPIGLIYDPGTDVAVPIFNQSGAPATLGFEAATGNLLMAGIDDSTMGSGDSGSSDGVSGLGGSRHESGGGGSTAAHDRNYNNWHLCLVLLDQHSEVLVSWVLGANRGWPPTNPTCQPVNITMETGALGYGG
ncbi:hypothetical protein GGR54DRAFT_195634 [Hypoxylon sp. NC1633]|nr:hypothetical protein GGR54DRAFT_195634 [Hypoxylon sp. NC1633]